MKEEREQVTDSRPGEPVVLAAFLLAVSLVSLTVGDLYPFTDPSLFSDAPRLYCRYRVIDRDSGEELPAAWFGLHRNYYGLDGYSDARSEPHRGARLAAPTLDRFGRVAAAKEVRGAVLAGLALLPLEHASTTRVRVEQEIIGPLGSGVGPVETRRIDVP